MKVSVFKKIKLYNQYRKAIKKNKDEISELNLRVDKVNRLYTVINLGDDVKTYGNSLAEKYIRDYIKKADNLFASIGLNELIGILDIKKLDETNYLIVFGFSIFNTAKVANNLIIGGSILSVISILLFIFL